CARRLTVTPGQRIQPIERTRQYSKNRRTLFMLNQVLRATLATALILGISNLAVAQYGGGGGMGGGMPGSPIYTSHGSYSNKGAIIGGVAAGAAVIGGLL